MNSGNIVIIKNVAGISNYAASICISEFFIDNKMNEKKELLIVLQEELENHQQIYKTIEYPLNNHQIQNMGTFNYYFQKNKIETFNIKEFAFSKGLYLSWLQVIQINEMNKVENNTMKNIKQLDEEYQYLMDADNISSRFFHF